MTTASHPHPEHPRPQITTYHAPGLFITGTGTDIGKTTATCALAAAFHALHIRVGVCKPIASGCPKFRHRGNNPEGLEDDDLDSPDATAAARAAGLDPRDPSLLPYLAPLRYAAPVSPALAARIEQRPPQWRRVAAAFDFWQENADLLLVEGAGGWCVPIDGPPHDYLIADMAAALRLPVLVVTDARLGSINQTLLTVQAIRARNLPVAGLVINRVPMRRDMLIESNLEELPRLCGVPVRGVLPDLHSLQGESLPPELATAMASFAREWWARINAGE